MAVYFKFMDAYWSTTQASLDAILKRFEEEDVVDFSEMPVRELKRKPRTHDIIEMRRELRTGAM